VASDMGGFAQAGGGVLVDRFGRPLQASAALNYRRDDLIASGGETVVKLTSPAKELRLYKNTTLLKMSEYTVNSPVQCTLGAALSVSDVLTVEYKSAYLTSQSSVVSLVTDPYFAFVQSLLHFDGADGSTTFTDVTGKTWTFTGAVEIDTAKAKFGGAAGLFAGGAINTPSHAGFGFGSGPYTVEGWIWPNAASGNKNIMDFRGGGAVGIGIYHSASDANTPNRLVIANNAAIIAGGDSTQWSNSAFQHWAVCRDASNLIRGFIDGVQVWSVTDARTYASSAPLTIGTDGATPLTGSLDEVRITKGVARYTANFTPPSAPFPNS